MPSVAHFVSQVLETASSAGTLFAEPTSSGDVPLVDVGPFANFLQPHQIIPTAPNLSDKPQVVEISSPPSVPVDASLAGQEEDGSQEDDGGGEHHRLSSPLEILAVDEAATPKESIDAKDKSEDDSADESMIPGVPIAEDPSPEESADAEAVSVPEPLEISSPMEVVGAVATTQPEEQDPEEEAGQTELAEVIEMSSTPSPVRVRYWEVPPIDASQKQDDVEEADGEESELLVVEDDDAEGPPVTSSMSKDDEEVTEESVLEPGVSTVSLPPWISECYLYAYRYFSVYTT
jgi:hypothetical protein